MAFTWTDIQNNENALSVRTKLNSLGTQISTDSSRIDTNTSTISTISSEVDTIQTQVTNLNTMVTIAQNISCPVSQWSSDTSSTYTDYPYKADLYISGTTSSMVPIVNFSATDQASGNYIGAESGTNIVTIWAKEIPSGTLTIPNIVLLKGVS